MILEETVGLFLGNIKDIYGNINLSELDKKQKIATIASKIFEINYNLVSILVISNTDRAMYEVMESDDYDSFDRVEIQLQNRKLIIFLEQLDFKNPLYDSYAILIENDGESKLLPFRYW